MRGKGAAESLESASHGAGRLMRRKAALESISKSAREKIEKAGGKTVILATHSFAPPAEPSASDTKGEG